MKRDKKFVVFIVFISFAITGVLQYMRSPGASQNVPYLAALEHRMNVFGEVSTNESYSFNSRLKPSLNNSIPVEYFVEEQRIIEEFSNEKQIKPVLCRYEHKDYISLTNGMRLVTDFYIFDKALQLQKREEKARRSIIPEEKQKVRMASSSQRTHIIKAKDNLYNLSKKYYKDESKWTMIYEANKNKMPNPDSLKIGQKLIIPDITFPDEETKLMLAKRLPVKTRS